MVKNVKNKTCRKSWQCKIGFFAFVTKIMMKINWPLKLSKLFNTWYFLRDIRWKRWIQTLKQSVQELNFLSTSGTAEQSSAKHHVITAESYKKGINIKLCLLMTRYLSNSIFHPKTKQNKGNRDSWKLITSSVAWRLKVRTCSESNWWNYDRSVCAYLVLLGCDSHE